VELGIIMPIRDTEEGEGMRLRLGRLGSRQQQARRVQYRLLGRLRIDCQLPLLLDRVSIGKGSENGNVKGREIERGRRKGKETKGNVQYRW
jgi:hypothetical protein